MSENEVIFVCIDVNIWSRSAEPTGNDSHFPDHIFNNSPFPDLVSASIFDALFQLKRREIAERNHNTIDFIHVLG